MIFANQRESVSSQLVDKAVIVLRWCRSVTKRCASLERSHADYHVKNIISVKSKLSRKMYFICVTIITIKTTFFSIPSETFQFAGFFLRTARAHNESSSIFTQIKREREREREKRDFYTYVSIIKQRKQESDFPQRFLERNFQRLVHTLKRQ